MKKYTLKATKRDVLGRKVKKLRKEGFIPATIYGKKIQSVSVTLSHDQFVALYKQAGETGLVELATQGETKDFRPVLIHSVQVDPVSSQILHVEFHQVDLKEKVHASVPVEVAGVAPAVINKIGVLITVLDEVEVEALPAELPEKISVDVSGLSEVGQEIKVSDLHVSSGVTIITDGKLTVINVGALISHEAQVQAAAEAAAAATAQPTEAQEGAATSDSQEGESKEEKEAPPKESEEKKETA
ncbi:50S ribosomal protein L25 [Candidatus Gottesmanbacteria bacterium]|nr:50S ribosomal protein L25 [Candidatus Gottesmanbacteria bacterium]